MINLLLVQLVNTDMSGSVESKTFFEKMNDGLFGNIAEFISNCLVYWPFCVFVLVMLVFLFTFKKRTKDVSKHNINTLKKNGKYIKCRCEGYVLRGRTAKEPNLFVGILTRVDEAVNYEER